MFYPRNGCSNFKTKLLKVILLRIFPGGQFLLYFAYGSNLSKTQMTNVLGRAQFKTAIARLNNASLTFSWNGDASYANIIPRFGHHVLGVCYELTQKEINLLDELEQEGFGGYHRNQVLVEINNQQTSAHSYIMHADNGFTKPSQEYLDTILTGIQDHGLPQEYATLVKQCAEGKGFITKRGNLYE